MNEMFTDTSLRLNTYTTFEKLINGIYFWAEPLGEALFSVGFMFMFIVHIDIH